ncbi:precorrin-6y C5,15-methyltransferase (decarboxylating) subunit CbiE [Skermanella mucosa]|uniref:precorrin-6y C5,15-methyltransferase (decarboxylating) subunit CbiE n=1 Tax=Skermanella mucosa TaxID=1789672 RepID=UPI00192A9827|nr:precorrin-6y C5,15-methyltransferase (decarboxylating) subunit CbiE [Skermanella mucosa]UEM23245.1 precorrin-6y C5,15-methyltransferase (decarboxylating) subunit CbiE [Skermanella mucosa]
MTGSAGAWLSVVGIGEDGLDGVSPAGRRLIDAAVVLMGGERHLAMIPGDGRERLAWPSPFSEGVERLIGLRGRRVCVLASGDPMDHGIGATLSRRVAAGEMIVIPAPGAFALACARMGWARAEVETLSLHGRPAALLHAHVQPGARLLILSQNGGTPGKVADLLRQRGYGDSRITVLEHLGGPLERRREWAEADEYADLNTIAVECVAGPGAPLLPRTPGLPDEAFHHDGQLTKREVRAATLAALAPVPGQVLWDVGAGCGSIALEWMRHHPTCRAVAIEPRGDRLALIAANAEALGCPLLSIIEGKAPAALAGLPSPDAVFIGGGITAPSLFETCWEALSPGGRLVANAVTIEGEQVLTRAYARLGGSLTRIAISRAEPVGPFSGWRPLMPVTQLALNKT